MSGDSGKRLRGGLPNQRKVRNIVHNNRLTLTLNLLPLVCVCTPVTHPSHPDLIPGPRRADGMGRRCLGCMVGYYVEDK